ncbi:unnamed protein product [Prunus brigantina]
MVASHQAPKCLCICGEDPKCTRRGLWLICTVLLLMSSDIYKKLELGPDMAKVGHTLNIPSRFHEWCWLLSEYLEEADVKSSRTQATFSWARNASPLRKKSKLPFAEKTQVGAVPSSSDRVKHLVGANSKKIGGTSNIRNVRLKPLADEFGDCYLLHEVVCVRSSSPAERRRDANIPFRSLGCLH